jgi:hypothetical protein
MKQVMIFLLAGFLAVNAFAQKGGKKATGGEGEGSKKSLDFDGDVVEGMNRQPLDSLTSVSEGGDGASKTHLYHRKNNAKHENREHAREIAESY